MSLKITLKTEYLDLIALLAQAGTTEDVVDLCAALKAYIDEEEMPEVFPAGKLAFQIITADIAKDKELHEKLSAAGRAGAKARLKPPLSQAEATLKPSLSQREGREREEIPHTPLEENRESRESIINNSCPSPSSTADGRAPALKDKDIADEFDILWNHYPRKEGRKDALKHYKAARRQGADFNDVYNGVCRFADEMRGTEKQYIPMGSTWFCGRRWEDEEVVAQKARSGTGQRRLSPSEIAALPAINPWLHTGG